MTTKVDFSSAFDTMLPNVYIRKVALFPATQAGKRRGLHYDEEAQDGLVTNEFGKKVPRQRRAITNNNSSRGLVVNIEFVIKDFIGKNKKSYWFDNDELLDMIKARVILCRSPQIAADFRRRGLTPSALRQSIQTGKAIQKIMDIRKSDFSVLSEQKREKIDGRPVYSMVYNVSFEVPNYNPRHLSVYAHTFIDLDKQSVKRKQAFPSKRAFLQGVTVAETVVNNRLVKQEGHIFLLPSGKVWAGPVHYHRDAGYMAGAFHSKGTHPRLVRKKVPNLVVEDYRALESINSAKLLLEPVPPRTKRTRQRKNRNSQENKIIKKFSYISPPEISKAISGDVRLMFHLNFERLVKDHSEYGRLLSKADKNARYRIYQASPIISLKVFRHRVVRGLHPGEIKLTEEYGDRTELVAMGSEPERGQFDRHVLERSKNPNDIESEKVVIGGVREIDLSGMSLKGIRSFGVSDYEISAKGAGKYSYSVEIQMEDGSTRFVSEEVNKLRQAIRSLRDFYNMASNRKYLDNKTGQFTSEFVDRIKREFIDPDQREILQGNRRTRADLVQQSYANSPWLNAIATFADVLFNLTSARKENINKMVSFFYNLTNPPSGTIVGIEKLLETMESLESRLSSRLGSRLRLMDEIDYGTRTAAFKGRSINNLIQFSKHFKNSAYDASPPSFMGYDFLSRTGGISQNVGPRFVSADAFDKRVRLEHQKYFGNERPYDFDTVQGEQDESNAEYTGHIDLRDSYYSYLTPARVLLGKNNNYNFMRRIRAGRQYDNVMSTVLYSNPGSLMPPNALRSKQASSGWDLKPPVKLRGEQTGADPVLSVEDNSINVSNLTLANQLGVSVVTPTTHQLQVSAEDSVVGAEEELEDLIIPEEIMGENTKFATDPFETEEQAVDEIVEEEMNVIGLTQSLLDGLISPGDQLFSKKRVKSVTSLDPRNKNNFIDRYFANKPNGENYKKRFLKRLPNQIKSIMLGNNTDTSKDWFQIRAQQGDDLLGSPKLTGLFYYNYNHINQIEVLIGFEKGERGEMELSRPKYRKMTKEIFDRIKSEDRTALVRMVPSSYPLIGFGKSPKLNLPEFDRVFIISPLTAVKDDEPETGVAISPTSTAADIPTPYSSDTEGVSSLREDLYVGRLTEYSELNETGILVLRNMVRKTKRSAFLKPEFVSTAILQQPRTVSKTGTRFGAEAGTQPSPRRSGLSDALASRRRTSRRVRSPGPDTRSTPGSSGGGY